MNDIIAISALAVAITVIVSIELWRHIVGGMPGELQVGSDGIGSDVGIGVQNIHLSTDDFEEVRIDHGEETYELNESETGDLELIKI